MYAPVGSLRKGGRGGSTKNAWITYGSAHYRVARMWGPASQYPCTACGRPAAQWAYDGTDETQLYVAKRSVGFYSLYPEFYMPMCYLCHRLLDAIWMTAEDMSLEEWQRIWVFAQKRKREVITMPEI